MNGDFESVTFFHVYTSADLSITNTPTFAFGLSPATRASCSAVTYNQTCTQNSSNPCSNPILDSTAATSSQSDTLASSGSNTGSPSRTGGLINVTPLSVILAVLDTSNTNDYFVAADAKLTRCWSEPQKLDR